MSTEFPIDAVITWVDGDDPAHRAKRMKYMHGGVEASHEDVAGETRYRQVGEIKFCIASILRFAKFVRKIFIVTDNQDPRLEEFLARNFPDSKVPVEIVDHKVIFRGYEEYLPTFNSLSITTMLWRIPDLSEHFILLNDDVMFVSPVTPRDFFDADGNNICYARKVPVYAIRLIHWLKPSRNGHKPFGFKDAQYNAHMLAGLNKEFIYMQHTPHTLRRSFFEEFFAAHPDVLANQIRHRFREETQFSAVCLQYASLYMQGRCKIVSHKDKLICMKPRKNRSGYIGRKMEAIEKSRHVLFSCVNSLDTALQSEQETYCRYMSNRLDIRE